MDHRISADAVAKAEGVYKESVLVGMRRGLIASYQKAHLVAVFAVHSSQWFECGCHASSTTVLREEGARPSMDHFH